MTKAEEILKIRINFEEIDRSAKNLFFYPSRKIENNIKIINKIADNCVKGEYSSSDQKSIRLTAFVFKKCFSENSVEKHFSNVSKIRQLIYALDYSESGIDPIISNNSEMTEVLKILNKKWRPSFISGLLYIVLKHWGSTQPSFIRLREFLCLNIYTETSTKNRIQKLKENIRFLEKPNGPLLMGAELAMKGSLIENSLSMFELPDSFFSLKYFRYVFISYFEKRKTNIAPIFDSIKHALNVHNRSETSKIIISKMIVLAEESNNIERKDGLKTLAMEKIGDPEISSKWATDETFSASETVEIIKAKEILNNWITNEFITVFFEECINEPGRKKFWLSMAKHIQSFKVVGNDYIKNKLLKDSRISKILSHRFKSCYGTNIAALLMYVNDYILIEFSDTGSAFYAYKKNSPDAPDLNKINRVDDLKNSEKPPQLFYTDGRMYETGKLNHINEWEKKLSIWMDEYVFKKKMIKTEFSVNNKKNKPPSKIEKIETGPISENEAYVILKKLQEKIIKKQKIFNQQVCIINSKSIEILIKKRITTEQDLKNYPTINVLKEVNGQKKYLDLIFSIISRIKK